MTATVPDGFDVAIAPTSVVRLARVMRQLMNARADLESVLWPPPPITHRELEVAYIIAIDGLTNAQAAERLFISIKTIEAHKAHVARKIGLPVRTTVRMIAAAYWRAVGYAEGLAAAGAATAHAG